MKGININCSETDFVGLILNHDKIEETRDSDSLRSYVGKRVGIVRTGCGKATLEGYATIGEPIFYATYNEFRKGFNRHKVTKGSNYDWKGQKYGYPLLNVKKCPVTVVNSLGIKAREIANEN